MKVGTNVRQWYYRGSLKTCNYHCSYCPFSKHLGMSKDELARDEQNLVRFVDYLIENHGKVSYDKISYDIGKCAVLIVPYGEALIHTYYWRELARLSCSADIEAVGAQTNLSFPVEKMLATYKNAQGKLEKLRLWGTFHPQQTTTEEFLAQCQALIKNGVTMCAGAVGMPENIAVLRKLRALLPENIYLWINKMDGLKRRYTKEEIRAFLEIDTYFEEELKVHNADIGKCAGSCFVESDGTMYPCNLCKQSIGNLYQNGIDIDSARYCTRKYCSCYLAYCNQNEPERQAFYPYPAFRIPNVIW